MRRQLTLALLAVVAFAADARAGLTLYTGSFSAELAPQYGFASSLSGSFSFEFDESLVTPAAGFQEFSLVPTWASIGPTTATPFAASRSSAAGFTELDTAIQINYYNGKFFTLEVGGSAEGVRLADPASDDFYVSFFGPNLDGAAFTYTTVTRAYSRDFTYGTAFSGGIIAVPAVATPEPGAMALAASGLPAALGLWLKRRRKAKVA